MCRETSAPSVTRKTYLFLAKANYYYLCFSQFSQLIMTEEYYELIISILFIFGHFWYMFFFNYLGQEIIDHSGNIFYRTWVTCISEKRVNPHHKVLSYGFLLVTCTDTTRNGMWLHWKRRNYCCSWCKGACGIPRSFLVVYSFRRSKDSPR